jgi:hypothetical protein
MNGRLSLVQLWLAVGDAVGDAVGVGVGAEVVGDAVGAVMKMLPVWTPPVPVTTKKPEPVEYVAQSAWVAVT